MIKWRKYYWNNRKSNKNYWCPPSKTFYKITNLLLIKNVSGNKKPKAGIKKPIAKIDAIKIVALEILDILLQ